MNDLSPATLAQAPVASASAILAAAGLLLPCLERGRRVDSATLRTAMETAFGASDASGIWDWKAAYDACEAATVLFLLKYGRAIFRQADAPAARLAALSKISGLLPSHTRRSEESQSLQQFSTPIPLGFAALTAAAIGPDDVVLEPSAGTGLLAILAEISGGSLILNELADTRADLLSSLFPALSVTRFDAAQIHDHLDAAAIPSVVLMNPPFSAMANVTGKVQDAAFRHIASTLSRLAPGGRLVTITGAGFGPDMPTWRDTFVRLQESGRVVFSAAINGSVYARHGTTFPPRLTVIDKIPAEDPTRFPAAPGVAPDVATLLGWIADHVPPRATVDLPKPPSPTSPARSVRGYLARANAAPAIRKAVRRRDEMLEHLGSLPPVPGALDQVIQHFGAEMVAEVTGRSRRIIRKGEGPAARLAVETRAPSANLAETSAFMDDQKRVLIFSDAGGTGRSYLAELSAKNQRLRVHYLLEPGWKADAAIQGLGRTNRTNQAQPPLFRPISTDVKAEKRFLSTIARRLDTLGAITRGQRQTGGQGLFRPEDNLESLYARDALRQLYLLIVRGKIEGCSLQRFEAATGLKLMDTNGIKDDLPPITTFLNRLLALTIEMQSILFTAFEQQLEARIDGAIASGTYDLGLETLRAESFSRLDQPDRKISLPCVQ